MWSAVRRVLRLDPPLSWYDQGVADFTPDMAQLCIRPYQRLFVCDEMMGGKFQNHLLGEGVKRLGAFTVDHFSLWRSQEHTFSRVIPLYTMFRTMPRGIIRGELWKVPSPAFDALDRYKQNGIQFERKRIYLAIPITSETKNVIHGRSGPYVRLQKIHTVCYDIQAWMYVGKQEYWQTKFLTGMKYKHSKDGETKIGRIVGDTTYLPVNYYKNPKNKLIEAYYYYSAKDIIGDNPPARAL